MAAADKLLGWAAAWLRELREHGRHARAADAARVLFGALQAIAASHDALAGAANAAGLRDWCEQLHKTQSEDPLLRYLWLAVHVGAQQSIVKWAPERSQATTRVVDTGKLQHITSRFFSPLSPNGASERLLMYAHGAGTREELSKKQGSGPLPDPARMEAAGLEVVHDPQALALQSFDVPWGGRTEHVDVPAMHLGVKGDYGAADVAVEAGIAFYCARSEELARLARQ